MFEKMGNHPVCGQINGCIQKGLKKQVERRENDRAV
jgi:hypothetical protein